MSRSVEEARTALHPRLLGRRPEIEQALITRVHALADSAETLDPEYVDGLRATVTAALDYGLAVVCHGAERSPSIPAPLLVQARLAARNGVGLDTVLRRYLAGYTLLNDFLLDEASQAGLGGGAPLRHLVRSQAALFDRLLTSISEEYARESKVGSLSSEQRRAELVRRLLAGELVDAGKLAYDLDGEHLGAVAIGPGVEPVLRDLAAALDCRLLFVRPDKQTAWAWLGSRRPIDPDRCLDLAAKTWSPEISLAIGEPAESLSGWRLTHRQARAALPIAMRRPDGFVRYADVALLASILQDDLIATSLRQLYLAPLAGERDGGETARHTLRAYFAAERNASSAAAALGVTRQAVTQRLRVIESRIGRQLSACAVDLEAALRLEEVGDCSAAAAMTAD